MPPNGIAESPRLAEKAPGSSRWLRLILQSQTLSSLGCQMVVNATNATRTSSTPFTNVRVLMVVVGYAVRWLADG